MMLDDLPQTSTSTPTAVTQQAGSYTYSVPLISAIMSNSKYIPLILSNQGLTLRIHLSPPRSLGVYYRGALAPAIKLTNPNGNAKT